MFSDAPFSQTYKLKESMLASPLHKPVNLSVDVLANPRTVSFQWYFKPADTGWELVTASAIYTVNNQGMRSELIIHKFALNLTGRYRLDASNEINGVKQFNFTIKAQGGVNYWLYRSNKCNVDQIQTFTKFNRFKSLYHSIIWFHFQAPQIPQLYRRSYVKLQLCPSTWFGFQDLMEAPNKHLLSSTSRGGHQRILYYLN